MTQQRINIGKISTEYLGDWNSESSYKVLDTVTYNGAVYMAYQPSTGETPDRMTSSYPSYVTNTYWTTEMAFLRPRVTVGNNNYIQFLQIVNRNGKLRYANVYGVDYTNSQYFSDPSYMCDVIDFTKGY